MGLAGIPWIIMAEVSVTVITWPKTCFFCSYFKIQTNARHNKTGLAQNIIFHPVLDISTKHKGLCWKCCFVYRLVLFLDCNLYF